MDNSLPPIIVIRQMIFGYVMTKAVHVAAKLNIAELISAHGPMTVSDIADKTGVHTESLYRLMRALASVGIFSEDKNGKFSITPLADCLKEDSPQSAKAMALMAGSLFYKAYEEFPYSIKTGDAGFTKAIGVLPFDYLTSHPEEGKIFDRMMTDIHGGETEPMVEKYDFSVFDTVVDIGGGNGGVISVILNKNPNIKGILFDLPDVINRARENISASGLKKRCQLAQGNFFESVVKGGDAYHMRHIIHDWNDKDAITILSNCRKAMNPGGKVLVVEAVIQKGNEPNPFKFLDLTMLLIGGKERTKEQFENIFSQAGLKLNRIVPFQHDLSVIEAVAN